jgi:hypothetical protein
MIRMARTATCPASTVDVLELARNMHCLNLNAIMACRELSAAFTRSTWARKCQLCRACNKLKPNQKGTQPRKHKPAISQATKNNAEGLPMSLMVSCIINSQFDPAGSNSFALLSRRYVMNMRYAFSDVPISMVGLG